MTSFHVVQRINLASFVVITAFESHSYMEDKQKGKTIIFQNLPLPRLFVFLTPPSSLYFLLLANFNTGQG